jgi:hypothetical protein
MLGRKPPPPPLAVREGAGRIFACPPPDVIQGLPRAGNGFLRQSRARAEAQAVFGLGYACAKVVFDATGIHSKPEGSCDSCILSRPYDCAG